MMFARTIKSTATDMYLQNMIAAVLEERSGTTIRLTQCKLKYIAQCVGTDRLREAAPEIGRNRPFANRFCRIEFDAYYAATDSFRGQSALPHVKGVMILTSQAGTYVDWNLYRIEVEVENGVGYFPKGCADLVFVSEADLKCVPHGIHYLADEPLRNLSNKLRIWGPRRA